MLSLIRFLALPTVIAVCMFCPPCLSGCGIAASTPEYSRGNWHWQLPTPESFWIHEPGLPFYEAYDATRRAWQAAGLGECGPIYRASVTPHEGPIGGYANGMVGTSTRKRVGLIIRSDLPEEVQERLVVHEMVHVCGMRDGVGAGRLHEDPQRWLPSPTSVEAQATCAIQPDLQSCAVE